MSKRFGLCPDDKCPAFDRDLELGLSLTPHSSLTLDIPYIKYRISKPQNYEILKGEGR